jgi:hypothetical protein
MASGFWVADWQDGGPLACARGFHERAHTCQALNASERGIHKGAAALLWGEPAASVRARALCWRATCPPAWGEPARPGFPRRGNGKGEIQFLAAAGYFCRLLSMLVHFRYASSCPSPEGNSNRSFCSELNRRLALLPFALFLELNAPVPVGVLNLKTGAAISVSN